MITLFALARISMLVVVIPRTDHTDGASLAGRVSYVDGTAIAGAMVSASNVSTRQVHSLRSDATGSYKLTGLRQGRYSVFVDAEGYCRRLVVNVLLFRGQQTHLDLKLTGSQPPGAAVCIEVSGAPK